MRSCASGEKAFLWRSGDYRSSNTRIIAPKGFGCRRGNGISPGSRGWPHARDSRRCREIFGKESEESCAGLPYKISAGCCLSAAEGVKRRNPLRIGYSTMRSGELEIDVLALGAELGSAVRWGCVLGRPPTRVALAILAR